MVGPYNITIMSVRLKLRLLAEGLRIGDGVEDVLRRRGKPRLRVRSGSCGGLDLVLPDGSWVNAPVDEPFAESSRLVLTLSDDDEELVVHDDDSPDEAHRVRVAPRPAYYGRHSRRGTRLQQIGQLCSDRLGIGLTNGCVFWADEQTRCTFCSIGLNVLSGHEVGRKRTPDVLEVAEAALADPVAPAAHILLGGGTPKGPDAGALAIADATRELKARWPHVSIYAMIAAPERPEFVETLVDAGVDEIGINIEVFSDEAGQRYLPGKRAVGLATHLRMLEAAVAAFDNRRGPAGPKDVGRVRSIMIAGLEPVEAVLAGVEELAGRGVMPILTPLRPMRGTALEQHERWPASALWDLTERASEVAGRYGLPLGPTCLPCQANTLNLPGHPAYRDY